MIRVGIVGATGYGARELLRVLAMHQGVCLAAATSSSVAGMRLQDEMPAFKKVYDIEFEPFDAASLAARCDVVFVGVPGKKSMAPVAALRSAGLRVIDIGPDFRLQDTAAWRRYYGCDHLAPELLRESVYGLVPWRRDAIRAARLVAVPGCYPISIILPLRPLIHAVDPEIPPVVDSISGISGAGRTLSDAYHFPEMNENLKAYKLATHQHVPEIEQELGGRHRVQFTPHVAPLTRGILSTITLRRPSGIDLGACFACYDHEPFVRVLGPDVLPEVKYVRASNFCDFGWTEDERTGNLVIVSAIDNLMGGTAGMAIQCMNLMFGLPETQGLNCGGMTP